MDATPDYLNIFPDFSAFKEKYIQGPINLNETIPTQCQNCGVEKQRIRRTLDEPWFCEECHAKRTPKIDVEEIL